MYENFKNEMYIPSLSYRVSKQKRVLLSTIVSSTKILIQIAEFDDSGSDSNIHVLRRIVLK